MKKEILRKFFSRKEEGAIALTTLLVISSLLILSGITMVMINIDLARSTKSSNAAILNRLRSKGCLEEALIRLKNDNDFSGTIEINYDSYSCQAVVAANADPSLRDVTISSEYTSFYYEKTYTVNVETNPIEIVK